MKLKRCPRCELNYVKGDEALCRVCQKKAKKESDTVSTDKNQDAMIDQDEMNGMQDVCPACGVRQCAEGQELCAICLKERQKMSDYTPKENDDEPVVDIEEDDMDGMQIIDELEMDENAPEEIKRELSDEDEEE